MVVNHTSFAMKKERSKMLYSCTMFVCASTLHVSSKHINSRKCQTNQSSRACLCRRSSQNAKNKTMGVAQIVLQEINNRCCGMLRDEAYRVSPTSSRSL